MTRRPHNPSLSLKHLLHSFLGLFLYISPSCCFVSCSLGTTHTRSRIRHTIIIMHLLTVSTFLSLLTSVSALGSAIILNNSSAPIYAWSVGAAIGPRQTIVSGSFPESLHSTSTPTFITILFRYNTPSTYTHSSKPSTPPPFHPPSNPPQAVSTSSPSAGTPNPAGSR